MNSTKYTVQNSKSDFIMQIISVGVKSNNIYEVQLILAPEADISTLKITVRSHNLRVAVNSLSKETSELIDGTITNNISKHAENFLIPDFIDNEQIRAIIDYHQRLLTLTAPPLYNLVVEGDYMSFERVSTGVKTSLKFTRIPDFYKIHNKRCFAIEMKIVGLKIITAGLVTNNILNIRLQELNNTHIIRNINFIIPIEANACLTSVEILKSNVIRIRTPLKVDLHH